VLGFLTAEQPYITWETEAIIHSCFILTIINLAVVAGVASGTLTLVPVREGDAFTMQQARFIEAVIRFGAC
jgi:hypothetical protein